MKCRLRKEENYSVSRWTGGKTRELAIYPAKSKYLDRDFIWRLSSATVEQDESDFSRLPDYDRVLMVLEGSVVLTYDGKKTVRLGELEQDSFDGAAMTKSFGRITDFNLMVRKGSEGKLDLIRPEAEAISYGDTLEGNSKCRTHALYCKEGYCIVNAGEEQTMVNPGQLFIMEFGTETPAYSVMGDGLLIRAQMGFDYEDEDEEDDYPDPGQGKEEKAKTDRISGKAALEYNGGFAEDFKWAFILANTQFRGAPYIFKKLKRLWYDGELYDRISKLEKLFVTFVVFMVGFMALLMIFLNGDNASESMVIWLLLGWLIVDVLIVSPLIYYVALPKPIKSHVIDVNRMSDEEKAIMTEQKNKNEHLEKLMKKYKNTGRFLDREEDPEE